jgi:hypothetical protein
VERHDRQADSVTLTVEGRGATTLGTSAAAKLLVANAASADGHGRASR